MEPYEKNDEESPYPDYGNKQIQRYKLQRLDKPLPATLPEGSSPEERLTFEKWHEDNRKVHSIILVSMTNEIQKQYDRLEDVPSIMLRMKDVYVVPDRHIRYAAIKVFFGTKMTEGSSLHSHGVKMLSLVEKLKDLKAGVNNDTYIDVILQSLPPFYDPFIAKYNMNGLENSIHVLINMLIQYEATTHKSEPAVLVGEASTSKAKGKGANAGSGRRARERRSQPLLAPEVVFLLPRRKGQREGWGSQRLKANDVCMHCQGKGHWKRECPQLLSNPGMFVVEINKISNSASWVVDTGCGAHICNDLQVLKRSRRLSKDEMILRLGNGKVVATEAVGSLRLDKQVGRLKESRNRQFGSPTNLQVLSKGKYDQEVLCWIKCDRQRFVGLGPYRCQWTLSIPARGGFSYFITFFDDHSRYGYVYLMRYKSEAFGRFKEYRLEVENQTNRKIKALWSDRGVFLKKGFSSDNRRDEVLIEKSSGEPHHDSTTSFEPTVHTDGVPLLRRSIRESRIPETYGFVGLTSQLDNDPNQLDIDSDKCLEFMKFEMDSMGSDQVWTLVDTPKGARLWGVNGSTNVHLRPQAHFLKLEHEFDEVIRGYDFIKNDYDPRIYKKISGSSVAYLVLYVDDMLLIGNDVKMLGDIKALLSTQFSMKDMGEASYHQDLQG
ncbi:UNVERIFIED_CONTAM: hypothetical protein Sradi_2051800 [Sesamum radiatum]|uniref:CCHC-type domain-containing protein n=1 Tax=Sesamum radiatum TaxID=300843 RepID=A0AAW2TGP4_SESRA